jgi:sugar phosphate isomerase/epimerase
MAITIGINQGAVMQARLEQFLDACNAAGVTEVELRAPKLVEALYHLSPERVREHLDRAGVTVTAVNSLDDFALVPDENLALLEREAATMADLCRAVRCTLAVAPVGRWFNGHKPEWDFVREQSARRLRILEKILGDAGVRVGVEPIAFPEFTVWTLEESMQIIREAQSRTAVLVADVYNLMQTAETPATVRTLAPHLGMIHVNDAPHRRFGELNVMYTRLFPGEGILDPATWVREALEGGYTGPISMEIFMKPVWEMKTGAAVRLCAEKAAAFAATLNG